jgi:hypothetical protein
LPAAYSPDGLDQTAALLGKPAASRTKPIFWQWTAAAKTGDQWPALAVRDGGEKLVVGQDPRQVELFRFPSDRFEKNNLSQEQADHVTRLRALLATWTATLPQQADPACLSSTRAK